MTDPSVVDGFILVTHVREPGDDTPYKAVTFLQPDPADVKRPRVFLKQATAEAHADEMRAATEGMYDYEVLPFTFLEYDVA